MAVPPRASAAHRFKDARSQQLATLVEPTVTAHGLYLEELVLATKGERTALQVVVDHLHGTANVELDTIAGLSEALSVVLDKAESRADDAAAPLAGLKNYELEVTTPGATRPLTEPRHFRRNIGRVLEIDRTAQARPAGAAAMTARLKDVDEEGVVVAEITPPPKKGMKPKIGADTHISFESIARARVQVEFSHTEP
ncbi:ribosome maturation factor RimP [Nesterenkonia muleiensis]|uniref:ribosome maturation factor RimP n=1 Tax=Nesterenkonia muleiensis TaxID=2282648 RepID=UPI001300BC3F|nr:ribosome maturation factor RimP [Nesterenkonia muleiensis]